MPAHYILFRRIDWITGFWMSDKPIVQQDLSQELASLILVIPSPESALGFVCGFWEATVREWAGIDRYR